MFKPAIATMICAAWAFGCTTEVGGPELEQQGTTDTASEAIKDLTGSGNGYDPNNSGHVSITFAGWGGNNRDIPVWLNECSGELITNWWVMTAKHCFEHESYQGFYIRGHMGSQSFTNTKTYYKHPSMDVALIKLPQPMLMNGQYTGYQRSMNPYVLSHDNGLAFGYGSGYLAYAPVDFDLSGTYISNIFFRGGDSGRMVGEQGDSGGGIFNHVVYAPNDPSVLADMTLAGLFTTIGAGPGVVGARVWARELMFPDQYLYCHGIECFTTKAELPNNLSYFRTWEPCRGQPFDFEAEYRMEPGYDYLRLSDNQNNLMLSGDTVAPNAPYKGKSSGRMKVWLTSDSSITSRGLVSLRAWCPVNY